MLLDLTQLRTMHPRLPAELAALLLHRAALALQRAKHSLPAPLLLEIEWEPFSASLSWTWTNLEHLQQHSTNRIIEDAAEAIALAILHQSQGWRVLRRMDEEHADWLLGNGRSTLALEVSGVARGSINQRVAEKMQQVMNAEDADQRQVCVVGFNQLQAVVRSPEE